MQRKLTHDQTLLAMNNATGLIVEALKDSKDDKCIAVCKQLNDMRMEINNRYVSFCYAKNGIFPLDDFVLTSHRIEGNKLITKIQAALENLSQIEEKNIPSVRKALLTITPDIQKLKDDPDFMRGFSGIMMIKMDFINILLKLAKRSPINTEDCFTLEPIEEEYKVFSITGHQFDVRELIKWNEQRDVRYSIGETAQNKKIINPYNNEPFSTQEMAFIKGRKFQVDHYPITDSSASVSPEKPSSSPAMR